MNITLKVQVRAVYGVERIYPMCDQSKKLTELTNRKTFTSADIGVVKAMGFKVEWVPILAV